MLDVVLSDMDRNKVIIIVSMLVKIRTSGLRENN